MKLEVHVGGDPVAQLHRQRDDYVLRYLPDTSPDDFVSLTMPVREEPWRWPRDLHPFFRQHLPEGYLLNVIREEFGPWLDGTDLSLLALVGGSGIGRVSVRPEGGQIASNVDGVSVDAVLQADNSSEPFAALVRRYARAAVSGMVPKFLPPETGAAAPLAPLGKPTLCTSRHIIKGSDDSTPYLGFNEFYSMRVLGRLRVVPMAAARMSEDGRVLVVERFDVDAEGRPNRGMEDACSLLGLPPHEKYATTTEKVWKATRAYLPAAGMRSQMEHFGWQLLVNYVVRNADCHAKNIALSYRTLADVAYAPVYDIVTTQAYPRYARNPPGLAVEGRQTWAPGQALQRFFSSRLGLPPRQYAEMVEALCESAVEVGREVAEAAKNEPRWRDLAKQMLHAWNAGMMSLQDPKRTVVHGRLDATIATAGFSGPTPAPAERVTIGQSELLAPRRRKRAAPKSGPG